MVRSNDRSKAARTRRAAGVTAESMEQRLLMSTNSWKAAISGNWDDASKWSLGHVPLISEDVSIVVPGTYTVSVRFGSNVANTLTLGTATVKPTLNLTVDGTNETESYLEVAKGVTNNGIINLAYTSPNLDYGQSILTVDAGTLTNATGGKIVATGTRGSDIVGNVTNAGAISVTAPAVGLKIAGALDNTKGTVSIAKGSTLTTQANAAQGQQTGQVLLGPAAGLIGPGTLDLTQDVVTLTTGLTLTSATPVLSLYETEIDGPGTLTNAVGNTLTLLYYTQIKAPLVNQGTIAIGGESYIEGSFNTATGSSINLFATSTTAIGLDVTTGFTNNGSINLTAANSNYPTLSVDSGTLTNVAGATINVSGNYYNFIDANLHNAGTLRVATTSYGLKLNGNLTQTSTGTYAVTLPSSTTVNGTAALSGLLDIYHTSGFKAVIGTKYPVMTYSSATGNFTSHDGWSLGGGVQVNNAPAAAEYDLLGAKAIADSTAPKLSTFTTIAPVAGASTATFSVVFTDNVAIDVSTLNNTDIQVTGPGGFSQMAKLVSLSKTNNGTPRTATYSITPAVGRVDVEANGTYTAKLLANTVKDTTAIAVAATTVGTFTIAVSPKLVFTTEPAAAVAGKAIAPSVVVKIEDQKGTVVTTDTSSVAISIASGPSGAALSGTATTAAKAGVATFSNLLLTKAGSYTLKATDGTDVAATSSSFTVTPGAAAKLVFMQQPVASKVGKAITPAVTVLIEDALGNIVTTNTTTVKLATATAPTGGALTGTVSVSAIAGKATFSNLLLSKAGSYSLKATDGSLTAVTSSVFAVS